MCAQCPEQSSARLFSIATNHCFGSAPEATPSSEIFVILAALVCPTTQPRQLPTTFTLQNITIQVSISHDDRRSSRRVSHGYHLSITSVGYAWHPTCALVGREWAFTQRNRAQCLRCIGASVESLALSSSLAEISLLNFVLVFINSRLP